MARARNIKPGFYTNEDLAECSVWARYIFPGLWMMADRAGRLEYRPKKIKGELLRFDEQAAEPLLEELQRWGFIQIYEVEGRSYIQILTFHKHQNPHHREADSDIPPMQSPGLTPDDTPPKPGAPNGSDDGEAQGETEASPGIDSEEQTCEGGPAVLIPDSGFSDSLIPDSGSPQPESLTPKKPRPAAVASPELPDWVPEDAWLAFVAMRKKIKAPLTDDAVRLAINTLEKLMQAGHRPRAVLEQSTLNSWRGLFEIKSGQRSSSDADSRQAFNERENAKAKEMLFGPEVDRAA